MFPPLLRQARVDETRGLMSGRVTPEDFSLRLEAAAAADRARLAEPKRVSYRHPFAGAVLILVLLAAASWLLAGQFRREPSRGLGGRASQSEGFGTLRPAMGAAFVGPALSLYCAFMVAPALVASCGHSPIGTG